MKNGEDSFDFFEIFQLCGMDNMPDSPIFTLASKQQDALINFRKVFPNLLKRAAKTYHETKLVL